MSKFNRVLQLNRNYMPTDIIPWRQAVNLVIGREVAMVLTDYDEADGKSFRPAVVCLKTWSPDPYIMFEKRRFSKRNVFVRDRFQCQYCAKSCSNKDITIDHVVPRSYGGQTSYENCVASCKKCNSHKRNLSLEKSGMRLLKPVRRPTIYDKFHMQNIPDEWAPYLGFVRES